MLRSFTLPDAAPVALPSGLASLWTEQALAPAAAGFALFDAPARGLARGGLVEVELISPLDGRSYAARRSLEVPDHWHIVDRESGWLAASGSTDAEHWIRQHLDIPDDLRPRHVFRELVNFSLPVTVAWLTDEAERERKLRQLFRLEHYRTGLRWLDSVLAGSRAAAAAIHAEVRWLEGRDAFLDEARQRMDQARDLSLAGAERLAQVRLDLGRAEAAEAKLRELRAELDEVQEDIAARRAVLAALGAQVERWQHWQSIAEQADHACQEHRADWQAYQEASSQIAELQTRLASIETIRAQLRSTAGDLLALRREHALLQDQLAAAKVAETAAANLADAVHQQQQLEQQTGAAQERVLRLEMVNHALQQSLAESKRLEVQLGEVDRQIADLEQLGPQIARIKKLEKDLEDQEQQARDAGKQVDHLHFLETAIRAIGSHLDDLRKGASVTERLAVEAGGGGAVRTEERTVAGHLREAIEHQIQALERQLRDWQAQTRELSGAPMRLNQLRAGIHQLDQELVSVRQTELKIGGLPALKLHRKSLNERFEEVKKITEAQLRERQGAADAPAKLSRLRQDLSGLKDPRVEQQVQLRLAARKDALEKEIQQLQRRIGQTEQRQKDLEQKLAELSSAQDQLRAQDRRREDAHQGYCAYLAQQAIGELAAGFAGELSQAQAEQKAQQSLQDQAEARETGLKRGVEDVADAPIEVASLRATVAEVDSHASLWKARYQEAADAFAAAEATNAELAERRLQLEHERRAERLLAEARETVQQAETALDAAIRRQIAEGARDYVRLLLDDPEADLVWAAGKAPALHRAGASQGLEELNPTLQACCALAVCLSLAQDASRLRTVFASDLGPLRGSEVFQRRLSRLPRIDQFLILA